MFHFIIWLFSSLCWPVSKVWGWINDNADALEASCLAASAIAAFALIRIGNKISRREKTIEIIREVMLTDHGRAPYERFRVKMREFEAAKKSTAILVKKDPADIEAFDIVNRQLNFYELVSLGIRQKVFDEHFFKMWFREQVLRDHSRVLPYMEALAKIEGPAFYSELRWLVGRWERQEHPAENVRIWTMVWWLIKGKRQRVANALIRQVQKRAARRALAEQATRTSGSDDD